MSARFTGMIAKWRMTQPARRRVRTGISSAELESTARYWDEHATTVEEPRAELWYHPLVQAHLETLRGEQPLHQWIAEKYLTDAPVGRGLGIGAGTGSFELGLMEHGLVE